MKELKSSKEIEVRFSEVDSMGVAWHGSYPLYFEDAREAFGAQYGLTYQGYVAHGCYAPLVELNMKYRKPLLHGSKARVDITYRPTEAAKVVFDYEIHELPGNDLVASAHSVQVFMDLSYQLMWESPAFYREWQLAHDQL